MLMAMNTGHEGSCGTIHANSCLDVPARLEALAALGGMDRHTCHSQIASALQVVVQVVRGSGGRRQVGQVAVLARVGSLVEAVPALSFTGSVVRGPGYAQLREWLA
jgi:pilus assembly protein CpaF